jgi:hypothetical protein
MGILSKEVTQDVPLMKLKAISIAAACVLTLGGVAVADVVSIEQQNRWFKIATDAADNGDYNTAVMNFQRVIDGSNDECTDRVTSEFLAVAQEARKLIKEGVSQRAVGQLYQVKTQQIQFCEDF